MLPKAINLLLIVLLSSALTNGIRRKSKIDLPITNAADAPINDNIAQASTSDAQQLVKSDEPSASIAVTSTEKPVSSSPAAVASALTDNGSNNGENDAIECDPDMIGFEIITGYAHFIHILFYFEIFVLIFCNFSILSMLSNS